MMTPPITPTSPARELCHRTGHGIEVTLAWNPGSERLQVTLLDKKRGLLDADTAALAAVAA
jgi:hypothetical protein